MSAVPVKRVRFIASGHEATINLSDFDPRIHEDAAEPVRRAPAPVYEPAAAPVPDAFDETPGTIATVNVETALSLIASADHPEALAELERDERASVKQKGGRKSVLAAIKDRRAALRKG